MKNQAATPKKTTSINAKSIEKLRTEVVTHINSLYSGDYSATDRYILKTKADPLSMIIDLHSELIDEGYLLTSDWLKDNFGVDELEKSGIFINSMPYYWETVGIKKIVLLGDAVMTNGYYDGESIRIVMSENASLHLTTGNASSVYIESYGDNKIDIEMDGGICVLTCKWQYNNQGVSRR